MSKRLLISSKIAVAAIFVAGLVYWTSQNVNWNQLAAAWTRISLLSLFWITLCVLASYFVRAARIYAAYRTQSSASYWQICGVSLAHNTLSFILPMRLGELALPVLSRQRLKVPLSFSMATLILIRLFDAHVLLCIVLFFAGSVWLNQRGIALSAIALLAGPLGLWLLGKLCRRWQRLEMLMPLLANRKLLLSLYAQTALLWLVKLGALSLLAANLGALEIDHAWLATIIADASSLSPITGFANAGTYEAAFALPLLPLGYNGVALTQCALNVHAFILATNIATGLIGAAILLAKREIDSNQAQRNS